MIVSFVEESHQRWNEHLHELVFAYNTAKHSSTGLSPALLNYGRQPAPLSNAQREQMIDTAEKQQEEAVNRWAERVQKITELHAHAAEKADKERERQAHYFNERRRKSPYQEGDLVWKRNKVLSSAAQGIAAKLAPKFASPCKITKVLGPAIYELTDNEGNIASPVHTEQIKPYIAEEVEECEQRSSRPPLDEVRDAEEDKRKCGSDVAQDTASGQDPVPAGNVRPVGKRARGRPRKTVCIVRRPSKVVRTPSSSEAATSKRKPGRPPESTKAREAPEIERDSPRKTRSRPK